MSSTKGVRISKSVKESSYPIVLVGRFWGVFPLAVEKEGPNYLLKWCLKYSIYSIALGLTLGGLAIRGMVDDAKAGHAKSIRMKTNLSKYVTCGDISVVVLIVFMGIFSIQARYRKLFKFIECINEVDSTLVISDSKHARDVLIIALAIILTATTILLGFDLFIWFRIAGRSPENDFLISNYIPFYLSYYIIMILECQYWYVAYSIKRRLKLLNLCLNIEDFDEEDLLKSFENKTFNVFKTVDDIDVRNKPVKNMGNIIEILSKNHKISDFLYMKNAKHLKGVTSKDYISKLSKIYLKLCDAVDMMNNFSGITIVAIILSCLLHLIVTPYFLVLEIMGRRDKLFITLQTSWIIIHFCRLFVLVEPCHHCITEAKITKSLVCKLLCADISDRVKQQLETFVMQLLHRQIRFSACGLAQIDRPLLTAISGAVTTYLVILIQFQKNDS